MTKWIAGGFVAATLAVLGVSAVAQSPSNSDNGSVKAAQGGARPFNRPSPDEIFDRMDANKDGMISRAEFKAAANRFNDRRESFRQRRLERMQSQN